MRPTLIVLRVCEYGQTGNCRLAEIDLLWQRADQVLVPKGHHQLLITGVTGLDDKSLCGIASDSSDKPLPSFSVLSDGDGDSVRSAIVQSLLR